MAKKMQEQRSSNPEYQAFTEVLGRVLRVSHDELKQREDEWKAAKSKKRPKTSDDSRASDDKD